MAEFVSNHVKHEKPTLMAKERCLKTLAYDVIIYVQYLHSHMCTKVRFDAHVVKNLALSSAK